MNKYFYIYNLTQSNYFLKMGVPVLEVGRGKHGDFYVKFPRNKQSEQVFTDWVYRKLDK